MKKLISLTMVVIFGLLFMSSNSYAQNNPNIGQKIKMQLNKFLELTGDCQFSDEEALRVQEKKQLKDGSCDGSGSGSGDCTGFVDLDEDGICDNCGSIGDLAKLKERLRLRETDGLGSMKHNGN